MLQVKEQNIHIFLNIMEFTSFVNQQSYQVLRIQEFAKLKYFSHTKITTFEANIYRHF